MKQPHEIKQIINLAHLKQLSGSYLVTDCPVEEIFSAAVPTVIDLSRVIELRPFNKKDLNENTLCGCYMKYVYCKGEVRSMHSVDMYETLKNRFIVETLPGI